MYCKNCGSELNGRYCSACGYDNSSSSQEKINESTEQRDKKSQIQQIKKKDNTRNIIFGVIGVIVFFAAIGNIGNSNKSSSNKAEPTPVIKITTNDEEESVTDIQTPTEAYIDTAEQSSVDEYEPIPDISEFDNAEVVSYKDILRYPDDNAGKLVVLTVKISQALNGGLFDDGRYYRAYTDNDGYGYYYDDEYYIFDCRAENDLKLLDDDIIKVYGIVTGTEEITRVLTWTSDEVAGVKMYYCELIDE